MSKTPNIPKKYQKYIKSPTSNNNYFTVYYKGHKTHVGTYEKAISKLNEFREKYSREQIMIKDFGKVYKADKVTLEVALNLWYENDYSDNYSLKESTTIRTRDIIDIIIRYIGYLNVSNINKKIVKKLINDLYNAELTKPYRIGYSNNEIMKVMEALKRFYKECNYDKIIDMNIFNYKSLLKKEAPNEINTFSEEEFRKLIEVIELKDINNYKKKYYYPAFQLIMQTGMRVGELLALTFDDFFEKDGKYYVTISKSARYIKNKGDEKTRLVISETKTGKSRTLPLNEKAVDSYKFYLNNRKSKDQKQLIVNKKGNVPHDSTMRKNFTKLLEEAEIQNVKVNKVRYKYCVHTLRHTFATILINDKNANIVKVSELLGHSGIEITQRYYLKKEPEKFFDEVNLLNDIGNS